MKSFYRIMFAFIIAIVALAVFIRLTDRASATEQPPSIDVYTPSIFDVPQNTGERETTAAASAIKNCRFGYNIGRRPIGAYDPAELARLRAAQFSGWVVSSNPSSVNGMEQVQVVRLHQVKTGTAWDDPYVEPYTYTIKSPSGTDLADSLAKLETIAGNYPGMLWLVGNEMEREDWPGGSQDEMVPELYAVAYHQIYSAITAGDPTAQVAIGGIVQATPLRLQYLDRVWDEYQRLYGSRMPIDVWNIHVFVLREKRHYDGCSDCWGAGVPAGFDDVETGMLYQQLDNKDFSIAREHVRAFRQWMLDKGERNKPLIVSEYGVLMPPEWDGFSFEEVRDEFMYPSFDMFLNEKEAELGYPADDNRLVQNLMWFSLDYDELHANGDYHVFNGWLFHSGLETEPQGIAPLGEYWEDYVTNAISAPLEVDLLPGVAWTEPAAGKSTGNPVTMTLYVEIANSGSISSTGSFTVEIYEEGGPLLHTAAVDPLDGCGDKVVISTTWANLSPGLHNARVEIDADNAISAEADETNNEVVIPVLVATERLFLPTLLKSD